MICEHCGRTVPDGALTCEHCGSYIGRAGGGNATGVRAIRQGRQSAQSATLPPADGRGESRVYGDYDLSPVPKLAGERPQRPDSTRKAASSRPDARRGVPVNAYGRAPHVRGARARGNPVLGKRGVNWMLLLVVGVLVALVAGAGYLVYMSRSDNGQRITARRNVLAATEASLALAQSNEVADRDAKAALLGEWNGAPAQSYWLVGQEYMDAGDLATAELAFRVADLLDPDNYDGLLLLANAYELDDNAAAAEQVYLNLANKVSPFRSEAYSALISMYQEQERRPEAADMMLLAYQQTDKESFRLLRKDYIPQSPQVDAKHPAGRYKGDTTISLISPQGYDIYYTTDDNAVLPQDGIFFDGGEMTLHEGAITLRAVCVSGDLVSDPMSIGYTIYFPSPPAPKCNLAPNTYKRLRTVQLRPGEYTDKEDQKNDEGHLTFYYTIDGSTPTTNSPVYELGTEITLPSGKVTLRAFCVNARGKSSSELEVGYKFDVKPYPQKIYAEEDAFEGMALNKTSTTDFTDRFGQPREELDATYLTLSGAARHLSYGWGYAVFYLEGNSWQLVRVETTSAFTTAPRGVGIGSTESEITAAYRDCGQPQSANGDRGLYYDYPDVGQVVQNEDQTRTVRYSCQTSQSKVWVLEYHLGKDGRCDRLTHYYQP